MVKHMIFLNIWNDPEEFGLGYIAGRFYHIGKGMHFCFGMRSPCSRLGGGSCFSTGRIHGIT